MAATAQALDRMDAASAELVTRLMLEDLAIAEHTTGRFIAEAGDWDGVVALQLNRAAFERYRTRRGMRQVEIVLHEAQIEMEQEVEEVTEPQEDATQASEVVDINVSEQEQELDDLSETAGSTLQDEVLDSETSSEAISQDYSSDNGLKDISDTDSLSITSEPLDGAAQPSVSETEAEDADRGVPGGSTEPEDELVKDSEQRLDLNKPRVLRADCLICAELFPRYEVYRTPCGHTYCEGCINSLFQKSMTDTSLYPPRCCRNIIALNEVAPWLSTDLANEFHAKQEELDDNTKVYCCVPKCSTYIPAWKKDNSIAECPHCGEGTCELCRGHAHSGLCPRDNSTQTLLRIAARRGWQRCGTENDKGCGEMVSISTGCNHMTCRCKREFCLLCGARWKTCACPQWSERNLYAQARAIARREGQAGEDAIEDIAEELRQNHDCDEHFFTKARPVPGGNRQLRCAMCDFSTFGYIHRCDRCHLQVCQVCRSNRL